MILYPRHAHQPGQDRQHVSTGAVWLMRDCPDIHHTRFARRNNYFQAGFRAKAFNQRSPNQDKATAANWLTATAFERP
jgi:hypothetical protein